MERSPSCEVAGCAATPASTSQVYKDPECSLPHIQEPKTYHCSDPDTSNPYHPLLSLWPLVRKRTTPTERPPLIDEIYCQLLRIEGCHVGSAEDPQRL
jgi:hypothetical protein